MTACHKSKFFMSLLIMTSLKCSCTASPVVPEEGSFYCGKGTFVNRIPLYGTPFCDLCAEDTFIDSERHTFEYCEKCKQFEPWEHVEETSPCTREHDTFIKRCESGFYPDTRLQNMAAAPVHLVKQNTFLNVVSIRQQ
ncbi:hypothetical protein Bpfe_014119 [Biomphalaria pfeifferi]|uniref:TNFR-Cys domain-containing protein n=1 Tax=Biomphalaria pfeifferi TaxID=112525 RepID=A0AAD8BKJ1_BIOPF|nr:hypothetical protein Bpfe_014119 [Biomphalaria pfeifferi]